MAQDRTTRTTTMQNFISEIEQSHRVVEDSERVIRENVDKSIEKIFTLLSLRIPENEKIKQLQTFFQGATARHVSEEIYYKFCVTAIKAGDETVLKILFERHRVDYALNGWTLLHVAAYYKRLSMMIYLLQQGGSYIGASSAHLEGFTCIHIAIGRGDVDTVKFFEAKLKFDISNYLAVEPVRFDIGNPAVEPIRPRTIIPMCSDPLSIGVGHLPMIQYLLERGVVYKPSPGRWDAIQAAVAGGHLTELQFLVKRFGVDLKSHDATVKACLTSEPRVSYRRSFPNFAAEDHLECFDYDRTFKQLDTVEINCSLVSLATLDGHLDMVKYLIKNGAPYCLPNSRGDSPMHVVCEYGHLAIARFFIEEQKMPFGSLTEDQFKESYLHTAARFLQPHVAQYLVEKAPHLVHLRDGNGKTPLRSTIDENETSTDEDWFEGDKFIDTLILLFDSEEFEQDDFEMVFLDGNQDFSRRNRFDLITCILANSPSVEKGYSNLMQQLKMPVTYSKPRDDLPEEEKAITRAKPGLQALAESHKFFAQRANIPLRLAFWKVKRIEKAASDVHDVAETCHEINFFSARLRISVLVNHILSFLTGDLKSETGLNIPPLSLAKTVRFFPRDMNKMERARLIDRVTQLIPIQSSQKGPKRSRPS